MIEFLLDRPGKWLVELTSNPKTKRRLAMIMVYIAHAFLIYMPFSGEGLGVYLLSYLALVYAAIIALEEVE